MVVFKNHRRQEKKLPYYTSRLRTNYGEIVVQITQVITTVLPSFYHLILLFKIHTDSSVLLKMNSALREPAKFHTLR
jgi:hypothetical protein